MSKYVVIPIQISLKNKKFAVSGDVIDESQLNTSTHDLVSGGFIRLATDEEIESAGNNLEVNFENTDLDSSESNEDLKDESQDINKEVAVQELSKKDAVKNTLTKK